MLNDKTCKHMKPTLRRYKRSDGGGLNLVVEPHGSKLWRLSYRFNRKQRDLALGIYPAVSLAMARYGREAAKLLLESGFDPSLYRNQIKREMRKPQFARFSISDLGVS